MILGTRQARPSALITNRHVYSGRLMFIKRFVRSLVIVAAGACIANAKAGWTIRESQTDPSIVPGVVHQHLVAGDSETGPDATIDLAKFSSKSCRLRLIDNPEGADLATVMNHGNYIAGVNGGYFDENFAPLGLRISDGKKLSPLLRARLMTGLIVSTGSTIRILRVAEFAKNSRPATALQCGPLLVDRGHSVAGLDSQRTARRTFAAVTGSNEIALGYCSSVSLADLSKILASWSGDLKIQRALNLDGGSSSSFWFKRKDGSVFSKSEQKSVRDFLAITPE